MILRFKDIPMNRNKVKQEVKVGFNLNKTDGWKNYEVLTNKCENLKKIVEDNEATIEETYNRFEKIHNKIKFQSFGKSRIRGAGSSKTKEADKADMNENDMIEKIMKERSTRLEKEVKELKSYSSRPTRAFKLLEKD